MAKSMFHQFHQYAREVAFNLFAFVRAHGSDGKPLWLGHVGDIVAKYFAGRTCRAHKGNPLDPGEARPR